MSKRKSKAAKKVKRKVAARKVATKKVKRKVAPKKAARKAIARKVKRKIAPKKVKRKIAPKKVARKRAPKKRSAKPATFEKRLRASNRMRDAIEALQARTGGRYRIHENADGSISGELLIAAPRNNRELTKLIRKLKRYPPKMRGAWISYGAFFETPDDPDGELKAKYLSRMGMLGFQAPSQRMVKGKPLENVFILEGNIDRMRNRAWHIPATLRTMFYWSEDGDRLRVTRTGRPRAKDVSYKRRKRKKN